LSAVSQEAQSLEEGSLPVKKSCCCRLQVSGPGSPRPRSTTHC